MATKPNFTVDPMPDPSDAQAFAVWIKRQLERVQDYWPDRADAHIQFLSNTIPTAPGAVAFRDTFTFNVELGNQVVVTPRILVIGGSTPFTIYYTEDLSNWTTDATTGLSKNNIPILANTYPQIAVISGAQNTYYSTDGGINWTEVSPSLFYATAYGSGIGKIGSEFFVCGVDPGDSNAMRVMKTSDGENYTEVFSGELSALSFPYYPVRPNIVNHAVFDDTILLAAYDSGGYGYYLVSEDAGESWTVNAIGGNSDSFVGAWYVDGAWFMSTNSANAGKLYRTTANPPKTGWTLVTQTPTTFQSFYFVGFGDGKYLAAQDQTGTPIVVSTDGIIWTTPTWTNGPTVAANQPGSLTFDDTFGWIFAAGSQCKNLPFGETAWVDLSPPSATYSGAMAISSYTIDS